jgi:hypothetical protein
VKLRKALAALLVGAAAVMGTTVPAGALTPLQHWYRQTHPTLHRLEQQFQKATHPASPNPVTVGNALELLTAYGLAHPPPGADRKDWQRTMIDLNVAAIDFVGDDLADGVSEIGTAAAQAIDMPVPLPGSSPTDSLGI